MNDLEEQEYVESLNGEGLEGCLSDQEKLVKSLTRKEIKEAESFSREQALALLGNYYSIQKIRVGARNRESAHERGADILTKAGSNIIERLKEELEKVENQAGRALVAYAKVQPLGKWAMSIPGVGPLFAANMLAESNFFKCCCETYKHLKDEDIPQHSCPGLITAGHLLSFAGWVDPFTIKWEKGFKRPFNQRLKATLWKIGTSFKMLAPSERMANLSDDELADELKEAYVEKNKREPDPTKLEELLNKKRELIDSKRKLLSRPEYLYVRLYVNRKKQEIEKNNNGELALRAEMRLADANKKKRSISDAQRKIWESGKLQPCGLDLRAMRYAVKLFVCHFHLVGRMLLNLPIVKPWAIEHGGHAHFIPPPNLEVVGLKSPF